MEVTIVQAFTAPGTGTGTGMIADYVVPLPPTACMSKLTLILQDGRKLKGTAMAVADAKRHFEEAKARGVVAACGSVSAEAVHLFRISLGCIPYCSTFTIRATFV
jgi:hypothetical protein